jgi:hypothetical protein
MLEFCEGTFVVVCPYEGFAFLYKVEEWSCQLGVVLDKLSVEVTESEKFLDIFYSLGLRPIFDCFKFNWVHAQFSF